MSKKTEALYNELHKELLEVYEGEVVLDVEVRTTVRHQGEIVERTTEPANPGSVNYEGRDYVDVALTRMLAALRAQAPDFDALDEE